jgi:hypothetical protein
MARIFTINFEFRGAHHAALVSNWKAGTQADSFQVTLYDEALHHLVPEGVIRFGISDESATPADTNRAELVQTLQQAIKGYLQRLPA